MAGGEDSASTKFPRDKNHYVITTTIAGDALESAAIHMAKYVNPTTKEEVPVGIKIVNVSKIENIYFFTTQLHEAESLNHENLMKIHCSFSVEDYDLWIIMSPPGLSVKSMILSSSPHGLPENIVAFILKETLEALHYMHGKNKLHQNLNAGCIYLDEKFRVNLAHNSLISDHCRSNKSLISHEIMAYYTTENSKATDMWMFGLLAMELFYGQIPVSDLEEFQLLVSGIENENRGKGGNHNKGFRTIEKKLGFLSCFHKQREKKIPKLLGEVMAACLSMIPEMRPTTDQLMESKLFQEKFTGQRLLAELMNKACKYSCN